MHQHGYVHNDLKESNIFQHESGHVTLLDLGAATKIGSDHHTYTQGYRAPEKACSPASDFFSIGIILLNQVCVEFFLFLENFVS
jgi:serine/threonine protein kinase